MTPERRREIEHTPCPNVELAALVCELLEEIDSQAKQIELLRTFKQGLPFCPDHRDKVHGMTCRQCEIERLTETIATRNATIDQLRGVKLLTTKEKNDDN